MDGISLFIAPKFLLDGDGNPDQRNGMTCGSLEHKMGINGNATCVMNYEEATGYQVGQPNRGLKAMFVMMNEARLAVGVQGLAQSEVAYQNAADWARDRLQGRSISGTKYPDQKADPIIVHPDIRRILMTIRAFNEGAQGAGVLDFPEGRYQSPLRRRAGTSGRSGFHGTDHAGDQRRDYR